jgi:glutamate-1-semialdehyde 2,1-aminomutase
MDLFKRLHAKLLHDLVYLGPSGYEVGFVSSAHSEEDIEVAVEKMCKALDEVMK